MHTKILTFIRGCVVVGVDIMEAHPHGLGLVHAEHLPGVARTGTEVGKGVGVRSSAVSLAKHACGYGATTQSSLVGGRWAVWGLGKVRRGGWLLMERCEAPT